MRFTRSGIRPEGSGHGAKRGRWLGSFAVALLAALALAACDSGSGSTSSPPSASPSGEEPSQAAAKAGGTVTARLLFPPGTLDPQAGNDIASTAVSMYAYDTLVAIRDGEIVPQVASKWEVTPTSAKFTLNPKVTCADGTPLTAQDVADSILRMKDPNTQAPATAAVFGSPTGFDAKANESAHTVTVTLEQPYGDLLYGMTKVYLICRTGLENPKSLATETSGTGPYSLTSSVPGDSYSYQVHEGYAWGPGGEGAEPRPEKVVFKVVENESTATNMFITGGLNLTVAAGPDKARLEHESSVTTEKTAENGQYTMYLNHAAGRPLSNVDARRTLAASLDREAMAKATLGPDAKAPSTTVNPGGICYDPETVGGAMIPYDPAQATAYAEDAGYKLVGGKLVKEGRQFTVKVLVPDLFGPNIGDFLVSAWGEAGIKVNALVQPTPQVVETVSTPGGDWDVAVTGSGDFSPSWMLAFTAPAPPEGPNASQVDNAQFAKLANEARVELTEDACETWAAAEQELYKQADLIPWALTAATWFGHDVDFVPWNLTGVYPDGLHLTE